MSSKNVLKYVAGVAVFGVIAAVFVPLVMFWGAPLGTFAASTLKKSAPILFFLAVFTAGCIWLFFLSSNSSGYYGHVRDRKEKLLMAASIILIVVGVFGFIIAASVLSVTTKLRYENNIVETADPMPEFEQRAPFIQAKTLLNRNKGGVQTGSGEADPVFLGEGKWSIIIDGGGTGLKANGVVVWDGKDERTENFVRCEFDAPTSALQGSLWNNAVREFRFVHGVGAFDINTNDAYGFCEEDSAVMIAPVTRFVGLSPTKRVFAGVMVVRSSEDVTFVENVEPGTFPGPVYPESLVMELEAANGARTGSFGDIFFIREGILVVDGEDGSPNSRNSGQFMLTGEDGNLYAVSPMNRAKGSGNEIVAVAVTPVSYGNSGDVNTMTIHMLGTPRQANSEIGNLVQSEFSSLNWFAGLTVMEITPVGPNEWVGSIGRDVSPEHRFTVTAERSICVTDVATGKSRGCSNGDSGTDGPASENGAGSPSGPSENLGGLSTQELIELRDTVNRELDQRVLAVR